MTPLDRLTRFVDFMRIKPMATDCECCVGLCDCPAEDVYVPHRDAQAMIPTRIELRANTFVGSALPSPGELQFAASDRAWKSFAEGAAFGVLASIVAVAIGCLILAISLRR